MELTREWQESSAHVYERRDQNGMRLSAVLQSDGTWHAIVADDVTVADHCKTAESAQTIADKYVYAPGRTWGPNPQRNPELFHAADITREIRYLIGLNKRHGSNPLRTVAYAKLGEILRERKEARV